MTDRIPNHHAFDLAGALRLARRILSGFSPTPIFRVGIGETGEYLTVEPRERRDGRVITGRYLARRWLVEDEDSGPISTHVLRVPIRLGNVNAAGYAIRDPGYRARILYGFVLSRRARRDTGARWSRPGNEPVVWSWDPHPDAGIRDHAGAAHPKFSVAVLVPTLHRGTLETVRQAVQDQATTLAVAWVRERREVADGTN